LRVLCSSSIELYIAYPYFIRGRYVLMKVTQVMPPEAWSYSIWPLIIVGAVILGVIFLVILGILVTRRVAINMKTGGSVTLTLASILLLSGLWCILLSPMATYPETKDSFYQSVSINGLGNWSYSLSVQEGDTLTVSVSPEIRDADASAKTCKMYIYDPDGITVWLETTATYPYANIKALKTGVYRVEAVNPNQEAISCFMQITLSRGVTYRPLEPLGEWLSLISLPIFGLGIWTSGILGILQRRPVKQAEKQS